MTDIQQQRHSQNEKVKITVMRTSDATRAELTLPLTKTLNDLKDAISSSSELGPIDRTYQRLFHLGRELKSGGRSLHKLGLGRFHNFTLHLHSTQPEPVVLDDDEDDDDDDGSLEVLGERKRNNSIIDLLESDDEDEPVPPQDKRRKVS